MLVDWLAGSLRGTRLKNGGCRKLVAGHRKGSAPTSPPLAGLETLRYGASALFARKLIRQSLKLARGRAFTADGGRRCDWPADAESEDEEFQAVGSFGAFVDVDQTAFAVARGAPGGDLSLRRGEWCQNFHADDEEIDVGTVFGGFADVDEAAFAVAEGEGGADFGGGEDGLGDGELFASRGGASGELGIALEAD